MRSQASVLHLDLDAFFAAVEQRDKPSLRGKPVVVGGTGGRGVVATASYEARVFGVHSAMSTREARSRCPHAAYLSGRFHAYRSTSEAVMRVLRALSPLVEPLSLDEAFVDLTAADLPGVDLGDVAQVTAVAERLRAEVAEASGGLTASVGVATSKFVAKVASDLDKPDGLVVVPPGTERDLLRPMRVSVIPGVGPATTERLRRVGVRTVVDLEGLSLDELVRLVGKAAGASLHDLARAHDDRPVVAEREAKSVSVEGTYEHDLTDRRVMEGLLTRQAADVAERLRAHGLSGRTVTIKVRLHDFTTLSRSTTLAAPTDVPGTIARLARTLLTDLDTSGGVRLLGVGVSGLADWIQDDLFGETSGTGEGTGEPGATAPDPPEVEIPTARHRSIWAPGQDVVHDAHGRGWVWGSGRGVVTVRFETAETPVGPVRSFAVDDAALHAWTPPPTANSLAAAAPSPLPSVDVTQQMQDELQIEPLDVSDDLALRGLYDVQRSALLDGREDKPFWSYQEAAGAWRSPDPGEKEIMLVGRVGGRVVGGAWAWLPLLDNVEKAWLGVVVDPGAQHRGHGRALLDALTAGVLDEGRTELLSELTVPFDQQETHRSRRFAGAAGYSYTNVEVVRHLALPVSDADLGDWAAQAAERHDGYRVVTYLDNEIPDELVPSLCVLLGQLAVDAPTGGTEWEEEQISPERFRQQRADAVAAGRTVFETLAIAPDGDVAAQTTISAPPPGTRTDASQWGTFVHRDHRGRRLGLAVKAANLRAVQEARPELQRVMTQNAETNGFMIAINEQMGFWAVEASVEVSRRV